MKKFNQAELELFFSNLKSARLLFVRKLAGLNQKDFADKLAIGVEAYKKCENELEQKNRCKVIADRQLKLIEDLFFVPASWINGEDPSLVVLFKVVGKEKALRLMNAVVFNVERRKAKLTREQLAKAVGYTSHKYISSLESAIYAIPISIKDALKNAGMNIDLIVFGAKNKKGKKSDISEDDMNSAIERNKSGESVAKIYNDLFQGKKITMKYNSFWIRLNREIKQRSSDEK